MLAIDFLPMNICAFSFCHFDNSSHFAVKSAVDVVMKTCGGFRPIFASTTPPPNPVNGFAIVHTKTIHSVIICLLYFPA